MVDFVGGDAAAAVSARIQNPEFAMGFPALPAECYFDIAVDSCKLAFEYLDVVVNTESVADFLLGDFAIAAAAALSFVVVAVVAVAAAAAAPGFVAVAAAAAPGFVAVAVAVDSCGYFAVDFSTPLAAPPSASFAAVVVVSSGLGLALKVVAAAVSSCPAGSPY